MEMPALMQYLVLYPEFPAARSSRFLPQGAQRQNGDFAPRV